MNSEEESKVESETEASAEKMDSAKAEETNSPETAPKNVSEVSFGAEMMRFIEHVDSISETFPLTVAVVKGALDKALKELESFQKEHIKFQEKDGETIAILDQGSLRHFLRLSKRTRRMVLVQHVIPSSFIVTLVSQFDGFLGRLIRALFLIKPELLNASEKLLSFSQLAEFGSIDAAKEYVIEKEVETVLRKSHNEQFEWLEKKLGIPLRKDLPIWPTFIEVTERRNLFVHTSGKVSSQYLKICQEHGVRHKTAIKIGQELRVSRKYFASASSCVYEVGVKLAQVMWRKLQPEQSDQANTLLLDSSYELLVDEKYELARVLLDFAMLPVMKHADEVHRRMLIVNRAQAYKWGGDNETTSKIMSQEDWSATRDDFRLAAAVLKDNLAEALSIMKVIGKNGKVSKTDYKDWPLFKELRQKEEFLQVYEQIFSEPFNKVEPENQQTPESILGETQTESDVDSVINEDSSGLNN